eukprot:Polyplicarium_translucidae@DN3126_c0_g1_i5.p1
MLLFFLLLCGWLGLTVDGRSRDFYKILGIGRNASPKDIKRAYRKSSLLYHPDKYDGPEEKFIDVRDAYEVLSDPEKRKRYDKFGEEQEQTGGFQGGGGFHGGGFPFFFHGGGHPGGRRPHRGAGSQDFHFGYDMFEEQEPEIDWFTDSKVVNVKSAREWPTHFEEIQWAALVYFYRPGCRPCEDSKAAVIAAAKSLDDIMPTFAINCQRVRGVCDESAVSRVPALHFRRKKGGSTALDWRFDKSEDDIIELLRKVSARDGPPRFTDSSTAFLQTDTDQPKVVIFQAGAALDLQIRRMVSVFRDQIGFAKVGDEDHKFAKALIEKSPPAAIKVVQDSVDFIHKLHSSGRTEELPRAGVAALLLLTDLDERTGQWMNITAKSFGRPEILGLALERLVRARSQRSGIFASEDPFKRLTSRRMVAGECGPKDSHFCFIVVSEEDRGGRLGAATASVAAARATDPAKFVFVDSVDEAQFLSAFGLTRRKCQAEGGCFVAFRPKRKKFEVPHCIGTRCHTVSCTVLGHRYGTDGCPRPHASASLLPTAFHSMRRSSTACGKRSRQGRAKTQTLGSFGFACTLVGRLSSA